MLVDGFGACHPRRCGSACQLGLAVGARAIGVGKSLNDVPDLRDREVKVLDLSHHQGTLPSAPPFAARQQRHSSTCLLVVCTRRAEACCTCVLRMIAAGNGSEQTASCHPQERMAAEGLAGLDLRAGGGEVVATALLKDTLHRQPVFVSVGHRVSLRSAADVVRRCCLHKVLGGEELGLTLDVSSSMEFCECIIMSWSMSLPLFICSFCPVAGAGAGAHRGHCVAAGGGNACRIVMSGMMATST